MLHLNWVNLKLAQGLSTLQKFASTLELFMKVDNLLISCNNFKNMFLVCEK